MPMTAVKGGAATRADWRSLVDLMKSADNRAVYDVTLGMVLQTDDGEKGGVRRRTTTRYGEAVWVADGASEAATR